MRGRCMLILIWLVGKYKKTRERIQTVQMNLFGLFIFKSDVRRLPPLCRWRATNQYQWGILESYSEMIIK